MWWKTTEVYRVSLPYSGIENLSGNPIKITSNIGIYTNNAERSKLLINELQEQFRENDLLHFHFYEISLPTDVVASSIKTPSALEDKITKKYGLLPGNFIFYEWGKIKEDILITSERTALINKHTTSMKIQNVLRTWIFQEYLLRQIIENAKSAVSVKKSERTTNNAAPQYDVLISVLNPRPDLQNVEWDVRSATELYIQPFLNKINLISNYTIKSQWKYQVSLEFPSKQIKDNSKLGRHYALSEEHFPYIITSIEKKLGNPLSDNACIHLVVYVQPCENGPLHIYDKSNKRISTNNVDSFISRNWGGVIIYNPPENVCLNYLNEPHLLSSVSIKTNDVMQILLYQLRRLVDFETEVFIDNADIIQLDDVTPRAWEIDRHYRNGIVNLISSTTLTLQSLIQLLGGISNIVINDEVGAAVNEAYENLLLTKQYLYANDIYNSTIYAKKAFIASELAFFHPSMLALLYFPDDQKYAIYIPLFLPIMIPVILSLKSIWKFWKKGGVTEKEKSE